MRLECLFQLAIGKTQASNETSVLNSEADGKTNNGLGLKSNQNFVRIRTKLDVNDIALEQVRHYYLFRLRFIMLNNLWVHIWGPVNQQNVEESRKKKN